MDCFSRVNNVCKGRKYLGTSFKGRQSTEHLWELRRWNQKPGQHSCSRTLESLQDSWLAVGRSELIFILSPCWKMSSIIVPIKQLSLCNYDIYFSRKNYIIFIMRQWQCGQLEKRISSISVNSSLHHFIVVKIVKMTPLTSTFTHII